MRPIRLVLFRNIVCVLILLLQNPISAVETARLHISNAPWMSVLRHFSDGLDMPVVVHGTGAFRILCIGEMELKKPKKLIATGLSSLAHLEKWTGDQGVFVPSHNDESSAYCIVLIENDSLFDEALSALRQRGMALRPQYDQNDLQKEYKTVSSPRIFITTAAKFQLFPDSWVSHFVGGNALETYYCERGRLPPRWLSEGVKGALQRIETGDVRIRTVAYERNDSRKRQASWAKTLSTMIRKKDPTLMDSESVMQLNMVAMSHKQYVQLWSFGSFVRAELSMGRGDDNLYAKLIRQTAAGKDGGQVLMELMARTHVEITKDWYTWARKQH